MFEQDMNAYWKTVVDTIQEGVMIVDCAGTVISVNTAFERITGYRRSDMIGSSCSRLNCDICNIARDRQRKHWCALFESGNLAMKRCTLRAKDGASSLS